MDFATISLHFLIAMSDDLIFLHSGYYRRCAASVDKRFEGYHTIQFISAGAVELFYDNTRHRLEPGYFWPAFPGPRIRFHAAPGHRWWTHRYVAFSGPLALRWMSDGLFPRTPQPAPVGSNSTREFDILLSLIQSTDRWAACRARNALERLLIELAACRAYPQPEPDLRLKRVFAHLSTADNPAVDYSKLATEVGMSLSSLRRQFKQAAGISMHAYALQCKISTARSLLIESQMPIKEIAERLGYSDIYYFTRQFRELSGLPPAAYRSSRQH